MKLFCQIFQRFQVVTNFQRLILKICSGEKNILNSFPCSIFLHLLLRNFFWKKLLLLLLTAFASQQILMTPMHLHNKCSFSPITVYQDLLQSFQCNSQYNTFFKGSKALMMFRLYVELETWLLRFWMPHSHLAKTT